MTEKSMCPICGKPTRTYMGNARKDGLCGEHANMLKKGELEILEDGLYRDTKSGAVLSTKNEETTQETVCVICGQPSHGNPQCRSCYAETKEFMSTVDRNGSVRTLRDYYYNLKERILIIRGMEKCQEQCNKLIAIALVQMFTHGDESLVDRVYKDVAALIEGKRNNKAVNQQIVEEQRETDEKKSKIKNTQDGHIVDSDMEVIIDDVLYKNFVLHAYGKSIDEITEKRKKCDWFIPICNGKGIYIEYWGMNTEEYRAQRKEKEELYQKHNIPYIGIEMSDPKGDTQTFSSNLMRELRLLAEKYYGFLPEWKK